MERRGTFLSYPLYTYAFLPSLSRSRSLCSRARARAHALSFSVSLSRFLSLSQSLSLARSLSREAGKSAVQGCTSCIRDVQEHHVTRPSLPTPSRDSREHTAAPAYGRWNSIMTHFKHSNKRKHCAFSLTVRGLCSGVCIRPAGALCITTRCITTRALLY